MSIVQLAKAVKAGDMARTRVLLSARPDLIHMEVTGCGEHRVLHYAVLHRNAPMVKLLMEAGADARKGIYHHRDATTALTIAREREYTEIVAIIEEEERLRREELSCPNATVSPVQDQINAAIANGDRDTAVRLLQADGSLIQACDRRGRNPLHVAAQASDEAMVEWLLQRRADVRKEDLDGLTPLDHAALAAEDNFHAIGKLLLVQGAVVTIRGAVALADVERIRELVDADSGVLKSNDSSGGLVTLAVRHGHLEIVRLLLDLGADVDERIMLAELEQPTPSWGFPLWNAATQGDLAISELLLDRGADPNSNVYASGWPLMRAWHHKDDSVKRLLLARGAKKTPYMVAETHDVAGARQLLDSEPSEEVVRELAWSSCDSGCPEIAALAIPRLTWPLDDERWHWVIIQPIRGAGGDSEANAGFFECMRILLRHGVDPNVERFGQRALHFAAGYRGAINGPDRARFADMLLDSGARLDVRDDLLQSTPLGWAVRWGRTELVETLIARGAPVDERDAEPWATPLAWAKKMNHTDLMETLRRK